MLAVTTGVFFMFKQILGIWGAIAVSVLFFKGWTWLNEYSSTTGLFKANTRAYCVARTRGLNHFEALDCVVASRYPRAPIKVEAVTALLCTMPRVGSEEDDLLALVYTIYCHEVQPWMLALGHRKVGIVLQATERMRIRWHDKIIAKMEQVCDRVLRRYGIELSQEVGGLPLRGDEDELAGAGGGLLDEILSEWGGEETEEPKSAAEEPTLAALEAQAEIETVYVTNGGAKYHRRGCRMIQGGGFPLTKLEAADRGYEPCNVCWRE